MKQDLIGQQFERWVVVSTADKDKSGNPRWLCRCDCGVEKIVAGGDLKRGRSRSCGCLSRQLVAERSTTHGGHKTLAYRSYQSAKDRCTNPNNPKYEHYGKRVILFSFENFEKFLAHVGPRASKKYSLDRINNEGNYEPGNVRWTTHQSQCRNTRKNVLLTYQNETLCIAEWAEKLNLNQTTIRSRIRYGWTVERTLSTPINAKAK